MTLIVPALLALCLLLPAAAGLADDAPVPPVVTDTLYKGVVGKALDALPMDPEHRAVLQRTNAVVSGTTMGRTLSIWVGLTNPFLMVGGLIWGIFSATNIKAHVAARPPVTTTVEPAAPVEIVQDAGSEQLAAGN